MTRNKWKQTIEEWALRFFNHYTQRHVYVWTKQGAHGSYDMSTLGYACGISSINLILVFSLKFW